MRIASVWLLLAGLALAAVSVEVSALAARIGFGLIAAGLLAVAAYRYVQHYRTRHQRPDRSYYGRMPSYELPTASEAEVV